MSLSTVLINRSHCNPPSYRIHCKHDCKIIQMNYYTIILTALELFILLTRGMVYVSKCLVVNQVVVCSFHSIIKA